ncbi:MAG TPA: TOBE domain-containing protein, partial [Arenicellales bacterium]|nr:TOBE domain-containing protein [Arenicellales bacterium]
DRWAALPDGEYLLGFRPHHLSLGSGPRGAINLEGTVEIAEISGSETFVHLDVGEHSWVSQSHGVHQLDVGQTLSVSVDPDRFILFAPDGRRIDQQT